MTDTDFIPRWASPPGDTIKNVLEEQSVDSESLAHILEISSRRVQDLLDGSMPLTIAICERLSASIGGSVEFWMTRDGQYQADLARLAADEWAGQMPLREMRVLGWIDRPGNWIDAIEKCFGFFGVNDLASWESTQNTSRARTRFRASRTVEANDYAVAAWLRQS